MTERTNYLARTCITAAAPPSTRARVAPDGKQNSPSPWTKLLSPFPFPFPFPFPLPSPPGVLLPSPDGNLDSTSAACPHGWRG